MRPLLTTLVDIVLPASAEGGIRREDLDGFRHVRIVPLDAVETLAPARAAGVRAASAPIVFIGETHIYPQPGWADALLAAFEEPWTAIVPAIVFNRRSTRNEAQSDSAIPTASPTRKSEE